MSRSNVFDGSFSCWTPQFIREHLDEVKANCRNRNVRADVDRVVQLDDQRKHLVQETQTLQQRQNELSKLIPKEKEAGKKQALIQEGRTLRERVAELESGMKQVEADLRAALLTIPNMSHPDAPVGTTAEDNKVLRRWGEPRKFDFPAKDHVALGETLDLIDFEAGARVAGQKFYFLKNEAVLLELALVQYAMGTSHRRRVYAGHHAGRGTQRSARGDRLHPAWSGNADLQPRKHRSLSHCHR